MTAVLQALVAVTERLASLVVWLRSAPGVVAVRRSCWMNSEERTAEGMIRMGQGDGYRIEWFVEADFCDGNGLSFGIDVASYGHEWVIDASARSHTRDGEEVLIELPTRYAVDTFDLERELLGQVDMIVRRRDEALALRPSGGQA